VSKDLITGEIAVAIHLLEPTIIVSTCVVAALYWKAALCGAPVATNLDSRLLLLVIIMGSCCFVAANCYDDGVAVGIFYGYPLPSPWNGYQKYHTDVC
jgi:hypothetical protein